MEIRIRELDKGSEDDWTYFDHTQLDSFRCCLAERDTISETELVARFRKFEAEHPLDYRGPNNVMYIAETEGKQRVGIVWIADRAPQWRFKERHAWIYNLNVEERFRRVGIARRLMAVAEAYARENGLAVVALHVLDFNTGARRLYESLGYRLVETHNESCFYEKGV